MRLPIDTREMRFVVMGEPRPVKVYGSDEVKTDADKRPIYSVEVAAKGAEGAEVLTVKLPGPAEAQELEPVQLRGLTAEHWEMTDNRGEKRSGISFRAEAMDRPTHDAGKQPPTAAAGKG